jgi:flagellum-specific peptidoglycan hydrolase FlgJ
MNDKVYARLIELCIDICKRNGKTKLLWFADKDKSLAYEPKSDEMLITVHRWFANKSCPGDWLYSRLSEVASRVTTALGSTSEETTQTGTTGLQATSLKDLTEAQVVAEVGALFTADQKKSGILASVSLAQFILESGYGKTELAQKANNCFGMKKSLSGNTWSGSTWDGTSIYTKQTKEQKTDGTEYTVTADFRKYFCIEDSIADHSAYLLGAMNGSKQRYAGLMGESDYKKAIQIIKDGGYATDTSYVSKIRSIIEKWNLTQYDVKESTVSNDTAAWYRVRKTWDDAESQKGAFHDLDYAKACADENPGYSVYDENGKSMYTSAEASKVPYMVKVKVSDLNIRKGAGTNYAKTGKYTGKGTFTIVEEAQGQIDSKGTVGLWGKLKSGKGWICLAFSEYTEPV